MSTWSATDTKTTAEKGDVVGEFIYQDEHGKNYIRIDKHQNGYTTYYWYTNGVNTGSWKPGDGRRKKIPYNLPALIAAPDDELIFIAEGEKDADRLVDEGLLATTNWGGAGGWDAEVDKWFVKKKRVCLLLDNESVGRERGKKIKKHLTAIVPDIREICFIDIMQNGDVSDWLNLGGTKEELLALWEQATPEKNIIRIEVSPGRSVMIANQIRDMIVANKLPVLERARRLVQPIWRRAPTSKRAGGPEETQQTFFHELDETTLQYLITKGGCSFFKRRKNAEVDCDPPDRALQMVLNVPHHPYPVAYGCIDTPTMRPDGSILDQPGYDPMTHLWYYNKANNIKLNGIIPTNPSKKDAVKALELLNGLLKEVPFANYPTEGINRYVAIAAIMTAVLRGTCSFAPLFLFTAPTSGSGKSYLVDLISYIARGLPCPVMLLTGTREEREKRIGALMIDGSSMVSLDNLVTDIDDVQLCQMLTQTECSIRILGSSKMHPCVWRGMIMATGNNINVAGDMIRRSFTCQLDPRMVNPEVRKFKFDPIAEVMKNRSKYVAAILTIAQAYVKEHGTEATPFGPYNGLEEWNVFVRQPLMWLAGKDIDPLKCLEVARRVDPLRRSAQELFRIWSNAYACRPMKIRELIDLAGMNKDLEEVLIERASGHRNETIDALKLGLWFRTIKNQIIDIPDEKCPKFFRLISAQQINSKGGTTWELEDMGTANKEQAK